MPTDQQRTKKLNAEVKRQLKRRTRLQQDARKEIKRILTTALARIQTRLVGLPSDFDVFILPQVQQSIRNIMDDAGVDFSDSAERMTTEAWAAGKDMIDKPIAAGGIRLSGIIPDIDRRQLQAMQSFITEKIKNVTTAGANAINTELGLTLVGAQPINTAVANIKKRLQKGSRAQALKILRTQLLQTYSIAAQQRNEQAEKVLPGLKKRWLPSGRTHARLHHEVARGQIRDIKKPFELRAIKTGKLISLLHPRDPKAGPSEIIHCGCESIPHMESWAVNDQFSGAVTT